MSFKRTKVVMLPTNEKAKHGDLTLTPTDYQKVTIFDGFSSSQLTQHLYFLSDDEIKEGDWKYDTFHKEISQVKSLNSISKYDKKIIATTDSSLLFGGPKSKEWVYLPLPQPSGGFIQKFVDSYNNGKPITEVDVELELSDYDIASDRWKLKVNPKDNTITIKKVKDSWSREEVIELLEKIVKDEPSNLGIVDYWNWHSKWIEENL